MKINRTSWFFVNETVLPFFNISSFNATRNGTGNYIDGYLPLYGPLAFYSILAVLSTIVLITVVSNSLIILSFIYNKKLRKLTNYFYMSLAISDLLAGLFDMPLGVWEVLMGYEDWRFGKTLCTAWMVLDYWIYTASTYTMLAICIDRYFAILHGLRYRRMRTNRLINGMIISCWVTAFLVEVPGLVLWEPLSGVSIVDYSYYCDVEWAENETYATINTLLTMFIPFSFILILSFAIWIALRHRSKALKGKDGVNLLGISAASSISKKCTDTQIKVRTIDVGVQTSECEQFERSNRIQYCDKSVSTADLETLCFTQELGLGNGNVKGIENTGFVFEHELIEGEILPTDFSPEQSTPSSNVECIKVIRIHGEMNGNDETTREVEADQDRTSHAQTRKKYEDVLGSKQASTKHLERLNTLKTTYQSKNRRGADMSRLAGDKRAVMSFAILLGTFLVLWTPWFVIATLESVCEETCVMGDTLYYIASWLIYVNSMINPFIYVFRDAEFKRTISAILLCFCCRKKKNLACFQ
ncbi:muscarinic acetylcholine receptor M4-like [Saccoglossus kowalevskii]|uniref:Muscarinic acetylcholine receptor M4-like n=1 Tax=Saccoglossus kowalevskii TaxID=10224 RepID=A0ABM0M871_SACKO|nr:PREDICTED: muscarinic acetylcholine receptor M4-like [Saccoglossus kowalevskii]